MNIDYNIKQLLIFQGKLDDWDVYLNELQENILSSKKSSIRIVELNDRKDLIKCEGVEDNEISKELQTIYKVIDQERTIYNKLYDLVLNPKEYSFFSLKSTAKAKRDDEIKLLFKKLFDINEEQKVRVNSLLKSLKLLQINSGEFQNEIIEDVTKVTKAKPSDEEIKSELATKTKKIIEPTKIDDTPKKASVLDSKEKVEQTAPLEEEQQLTNSEKTPIEPAKAQEEEDEFDYESEVKRLLGL